MSDSSLIKIVRNVPSIALFTHMFKIIWVNLNLKNCAWHFVSYTSRKSIKCLLKKKHNRMPWIHPTVGKVYPTRHLRPSVHIHLIAVYVTLYVSVSLTLSSDLQVSAAWRIWPYWIHREARATFSSPTATDLPAGFQAAHSQDFSVLRDTKSQCPPLLGEFSHESLTQLLFPWSP